MKDQPSLNQTTRPLRRYSITVEGYDPVAFDATTASKARYAAYKAFCDATKRIAFLDFCERVSTLHMGVATDAR